MINDIRKEIQKCIDAGEKDFIIAPFGYWGKKVKEILNDEYGVREIFCVDNNHFDRKCIFPIDQMPELNKNYVILITAADEYIRYQFVDLFCRYISMDRIKICIDYQEQAKKVFEDSSKVKLDFLCVGFAKCGTTSMQAALSWHPQIYLPKEKETFFIKRIDEENHQKFKESYAPEKTKGRLVGGIEPTYFMNAESVYRYFGSDLKIIMCMANPMKALYSRFKMAMRDSGEQELAYLKKYGKVTPELFDEWAERNAYLYQYMNYLKSYLRFYKKSQMQIIISELLYNSTRDKMDELQTFLGIESGDKLVYDEFPHVNKGVKVSKSYAAACVNKKMWDLFAETKDLDTKLQIRDMRYEIFEITTEQYTEPMLEKTYLKLFRYYKEGIYELESFLGMSLKGIWYE